MTKMGYGANLADAIEEISGGRLGFYVFPDGYGTLAYHPDVYKFVLKHPDLFGREAAEGVKEQPVPYSRRTQGVLGRTPLTLSKGPAWQAGRERLHQPLGVEARREEFIARVFDQARGLAEKLKQRQGQVVDVHAPLQDFTYRIIAGLAFGEDAELAQQFRSVWDILNTKGGQYIAQLLPIANPWLGGPKLVRALAKVIEVLRKPIENLQESRYVHDDKGFLGQMAQGGLAAQSIIDELKTFFFAGHDTTTNAMTGLLYGLAQRPQLRDKIYQELRTFMGSAGGSSELSIATLRDWGKLVSDHSKDTDGPLILTRAAIKETLRRFSPVHGFLRIVRGYESINLAGVKLNPGDSIFVPILALQTSTEIWGADAHDFKPERFLEPLTSTQKDAYKPFGDNAHRCAGEHLGLLQMYLTLMALAEKGVAFDADPQEGPLQLETVITTRMKGGKCPLYVDRFKS